MSICDIDPKQVQEKLAENSILLLDVRERDEFDEGHIESATNLPLKTISAKDVEALTKEAGQLIVLQCLGGKRSMMAAEKLQQDGFSGDLYNMVGGFKAWQEAGLPVTVAASKTKKNL